MKKMHVTLLRAVIGALNLIVAALVATSLYPVVTGSFKLILPEDKDVSWEIEGEELILKTNFTIDNGGFYDITDVDVFLRVSNRTGKEIIADSLRIDVIKSMSRHVQAVEVPIKLRTFIKEGLDYLVFENDVLKMHVDINAKYTFRIVEFSGWCDICKNWTALIGDIIVDEKNVSASYDGKFAKLHVPYEVTTAGWLEGTVTVLVNLFNGTNEFISTNATTVQLGGKRSGAVDFEFDEVETEELITKSQRLRIMLSVYLPNVENFSFERVFYYNWGAPLNNFTTYTPIVKGMNITVPFSFRNDSPKDLALTITIDIYHNSSTLLGFGSTNAEVPHGTDYSGNITLPILPHKPNFYIVRVSDDNSGLVYETTEVVS